MILSIGEILVDVFNDGKTETVFPGGAPFNVAANIASFGGDVLFCGAIGKDDYGSFLKQYISNSYPRTYSDGKNKYENIWFEGNINLKEIPKGEYTIYISARKDNYECVNLFRNIFFNK